MRKSNHDVSLTNLQLEEPIHLSAMQRDVCSPSTMANDDYSFEDIFHHIFKKPTTRRDI
jgi:hypothetical protein